VALGRDSAHYIALTHPSKMTTNFRPNFNHENGHFRFKNIIAILVLNFESMEAKLSKSAPYQANSPEQPLKMHPICTNFAPDLL
jgi:hypothetical protein